jgi:repressor LexA
MKEPTTRQKEVLSFISAFITKHRYPPTIREVANHFTISVKGAYDHVSALRKKGKIRLDARHSRAMEIVHDGSEPETENFVNVPILGKIAAGRPILAEENWEGTYPIHISFLKKNRRYFGLHVVGDSMKDAGILDQDIALIQKTSTAKNGDIVAAAMEDDTATLKRFYKETNRVRLQPENAAYNPIYSCHVRILGKLAYVIRTC